jgi:hypothetical protein
VRNDPFLCSLECYAADHKKGEETQRSGPPPWVLTGSGFRAPVRVPGRRSDPVEALGRVNRWEPGRSLGNFSLVAPHRSASATVAELRRHPTVGKNDPTLFTIP